MADSGSQNPEQAALNSVDNILKLLTTLSTGALVFSVGLLAPAGVVYMAWMKWLLVVTWVLFFLAAAAGVYAQSVIPNQIRKRQEDITSRELRGAAIFLEMCFLFGILALAATLIVTLLGRPTAQRVAIGTPLEALTRASTCTAGRYRTVGIEAVELLKGLNDTRLEQSSWHVRMRVQTSHSRTPQQKTMDVYVNPVTAKIYDPAHIAC